MKHPKNPERQTANSGHKWENFIRPIWEKHVQKPKQKVKRQQKKTQGFSQEIQTPCVNGWNC